MMSGLLFVPAAFPSRKARLDWVERANQATHATGAVLSVIGAAWLVSQAISVGNSRLTAGCLIYGTSLVLLYAASALSHSFRHGWWKHTFRTLDQVFIFVLIAGSYTPVGLTVCSHYWPVLSVIWSFAALGILAKLFWTGIRNVPLWFYLLLGWMPLLSAPPILAHFTLFGLSWIIAGGVFYTLGTVFLALDERVPCFHPVWHLMVMAGSGCHFVVMGQYLVPSLS